MRVPPPCGFVADRAGETPATHPIRPAVCCLRVTGPWRSFTATNIDGASGPAHVGSPGRPPTAPREALAVPAERTAASRRAPPAKLPGAGRDIDITAEAPASWISPAATTSSPASDETGPSLPPTAGARRNMDGERPASPAACRSRRHNASRSPAGRAPPATLLPAAPGSRRRVGSAWRTLGRSNAWWDQDAQNWLICVR